MKREIKFRAWHNPSKQMLGEVVTMDFGKYKIPSRVETVCTDCLTYVEVKDCEIMQFTGLLDRNGKEIYEGDLLRIWVEMGDKKEYVSDAIYRVNELSYSGLRLSFTKLTTDDPKNQYPICQSPSFEFHSLGVDYINSLFDRLALLDTYGENHLSRTRWQENHYSNDIEIIGNIYENPELLK